MELSDYRSASDDDLLKHLRFILIAFDERKRRMDLGDLDVAAGRARELTLVLDYARNRQLAGGVVDPNGVFTVSEGGGVDFVVNGQIVGRNAKAWVSPVGSVTPDA